MRREKRNMERVQEAVVLCCPESMREVAKAAALFGEQYECTTFIQTRVSVIDE
jgi:hypothetical protein